MCQSAREITFGVSSNSSRTLIFERSLGASPYLSLLLADSSYAAPTSGTDKPYRRPQCSAIKRWPWQLSQTTCSCPAQYRNIKLMVDEYMAKLAMEGLSISSKEPQQDDQKMQMG
ncbi:uncharacterized protein ALTATR162_LOCUS4791 [Alternaria atra]|uniref:Uncharacterized protein n=1 Tax=Alternaria atra TaxID=119953 RepID=A0A8J2MZG5_9PLEO|nr:uncharacterized protein ALTATR162_LOCUS4791 [Alternaria atra]CAG5156998.1 unnamed protein product [Alternaria atra]